MKRFSWVDLSNVDDEPGIYAWYYSPEVTLFDLELVIERANASKAAGRTEDARIIIQKFLEERLFRFFREDPYLARLSGSLKPAYEGQLEHQFTVSETLTDRLTESPERLRTIRQVLELSAPHFASPIYIGMADNLRARIATHKRLIERYRNTSTPQNPPDRQARESSFAYQIVQRRIPPERLFVVTCAIDSAEGIHVDAENILNRIYYPLLGKN